MRKSTTSRGFGIIEALIGILILGLVVGGTVRTVQAIRAHEAATEAYSQDQSQIKANADLVTGGNIVVSSGADGIKYMAAAGNASTPVKTKVIFSNNDGVGVVDELVQMENAKGWLAVGAVSRLEDKPETVVPDTSTLTLAVNPVQVNVGENYSVSWTSSGMERVIVQELNETGASVEFGNTLSNTGKTTSKSVAGVYTYKATGYYKGGTKAAVAQVTVIKPFAGDLNIEVSADNSSWGKEITVLPSQTYYVRYSFVGFPSAGVTKNGGYFAGPLTTPGSTFQKTDSGTAGQRYTYTITATDGSQSYTAVAAVNVVKAMLWATNESNVPIKEIPVGMKFRVWFYYEGFSQGGWQTRQYFNSAGSIVDQGQNNLIANSSNSIYCQFVERNGRISGKGWQAYNASSVQGYMKFGLTDGSSGSVQAACQVNAVLSGNIKANPETLTEGGSTEISWGASSSNVDLKVLRNDAQWATSRGASSRTDGNMSKGSYTYKLLTSDNRLLDQCSVQVGPGTTGSTVWIRANRVKSANVRNGQYYTIEWGSGNVSSAKEEGRGLSETSVSGSKQIKATSNGTFTYTIRSTDGSNKTDSCKVTVSSSKSNGEPVVSIAASATRVRVNEAYTISWASENCTSVAVSGPGLSSNKFSGTSAPISQARTGIYTYTITGQPGGVTDSVSVVVEAAYSGGGGGSVEIWSNVPEVTQGESFTVSWKSSGESGVTVVGSRPTGGTPSGWSNSNSLSGNQNMQTTTDESVWPLGDYTFTITGNSGATASCRVKVLPPNKKIPIYTPKTIGTSVVITSWYNREEVVSEIMNALNRQLSPSSIARIQTSALVPEYTAIWENILGDDATTTFPVQLHVKDPSGVTRTFNFTVYFTPFSEHGCVPYYYVDDMAARTTRCSGDPGSRWYCPYPDPRYPDGTLHMIATRLEIHGTTIDWQKSL